MTAAQLCPYLGIVRGGGESYLLGPCCLTGDTVSAADLLKRRHRLSPDRPYRVSVATIEDFSNVTLLLSEAVGNKPEDVTRLCLDSFCSTAMLEDTNRQLNQVFYENQEKATLHNPYQQVQREQESIRTGNREALLVSFGDVYVGQIGKLAPTPLRQAKNLAIACGLLPEIAFSMSDGLHTPCDADAEYESVVVRGYIRILPAPEQRRVNLTEVIRKYAPHLARLK